MPLSRETLAQNLDRALAHRLTSLADRLSELTVVIKPVDWPAAALALRDDAGLRFDQLIDLCGVDYSEYGGGAWEGRR
jgi:NADH-quinone oxidoreductase subunit C